MNRLLSFVIAAMFVALSAALPASAAVALNANSQAQITAHGAGAHQVIVTAQDNQGTQTRQGAFGVRDPGVTTLPTVALTAPADGDVLTAATPVAGSVNSAGLLYWQLLVSPAGQSQWREIARGTQNIQGALGTFDPTQLPNGQYDLLLQAFNANGQQASQLITVLVWGNLKLGEFTVSFNDLQLQAGGLPLMVTRTYDSRKKDTKGDFGYGWMLGYQNVTLQRNAPLGEQWQIYQSGFMTFCVRPVGKRTVSIVMDDGKVHQFDIDGTNNCQIGQVPTGSLLGLTFVPRAGTTSTLEILDGGNWLYIGDNIVNDSTGELYDSLRYRLTTLENYQYILASQDGKTFRVEQITDPNGQTLTFTQNAITSSVGMAIQLQRDTQGRITQISDPAGRAVRYAYTEVDFSQRDETAKTQTYTLRPSRLRPITRRAANRSISDMTLPRSSTWERSFTEARLLGKGVLMTAYFGPPSVGEFGWSPGGALRL